MSNLISQFVDAIEQWSNLTGTTPRLIPGYMFMMSGGVWTGAESFPESLTLDNTRKFLEIQVKKTGFTEDFLVVAFVRCIEDVMRVELEMNEEKRAGIKDRPDFIRRLAANPTMFETLKRRIKEQRSEFRDLGVNVPDAEEITPEKLSEMADDLENLTRSDPGEALLSEMQKEEYLRVWREVTAPILEARNIRILGV